MKIFKRVLFGLIAVLIIALIAGYFHLNSKVAVRSGELRIDGLTNKVEVIFDTWGIPHVTAQNQEDMFRAFGYVHAQDRLFQMEIMKRLSQGRLAEVLGEKLVKVDRLFRSLRIHHFSRQWLKELIKRTDPRVFRHTRAYLDGVNQFVKQGPTPVEFEILGITKEDFTVEDVLSITGYVSYSFAMAFREDPLVHQIATELGEDYFKDLGVHWQAGSTQIPVQLESKVLSALVETIKSLDENYVPAGLFQGSNSWVLGPSKTKNGSAIFVNDPHIGYSQPSVWYEAHLTAPGYELYGHHMALIPFGFLGFNKHMAWGVTMFENDDMDFYREKVNPDNPDQYWVMDHWEDFETRKEIIKVKGADDIILTLRSSRHGPVITDAFSGFDDIDDPLIDIKEPLAMWWAFHDLENDGFVAFDELARSKNVREAQEAAAMLHAPGLNIMYANSNGDIAWWAAAKLPIRPGHVNSKMILDGASGKDDILGFYDFSANPQSVNPAGGMIYSANNQPADMGKGLVPGYYAPRDRAARIVEKLDTGFNQWTADDMKKLLLDNKSPLVEMVKGIVLPVLKTSSTAQKEELSRQAIAKLDQWDGNHAANRIAPGLFYRFKKILFKHIMLDELGENKFNSMQSGFLLKRTIWKLLPNSESIWWDNKKTLDKEETAAEIIVAAWLETIDYLREKSGSRIEDWKWSQQASLEHIHALGTIKPLNKIFNVGPFPVAAGQEIINNLTIAIEKDDFPVRSGPSTRRIVDFAEVDQSWGINPTGQAGNIMDPHYDDQAAMFVKGQYRRQYFNRKDILENSEGTLIFQPK